MKHLPNAIAAVTFLIGLGTGVLAGQTEEITLENGSKVTGAIVGFENGMFKVETEFGFALVRKDKVKSISFAPGDANRTASPKAAVRAAEPKAASEQPISPSKPVESKAPVVTEAKSAPPKPPPPPVSRPLDEPLPEKIEAHVEGNNYVNETFAFRLYKPPGWTVHEDAARETGHAIAAIGTANEHTILFVDRQVWSGDPNLKSDATEARIRATYQNYRKTAETSMVVAGQPAIRKEFEGELDGALWRGVALRIAKGHAVFGVIGLTSSETLEFHQAILNKMINSFEFLPSPNPATVNR